MNISYLLLGSNLGDKTTTIKTAVDLIGSMCGNIFHKSSLYETSPWGVTDQSFFLNMVVGIETMHAPEHLLELLLQIEKKLGRVRIEKWRERTIDLDILYYNDLIYSSNSLTLPHPEIQNRKFTLVPLCEIAPDFIHPVLKQTNQELLDNCADKEAVVKRFIF